MSRIAGLFALGLVLLAGATALAREARPASTEDVEKKMMDRRLICSRLA
jgi:hypothetical protein